VLMVTEKSFQFTSGTLYGGTSQRLPRHTHTHTHTPLVPSDPKLRDSDENTVSSVSM
jgi:hypothetical protein